MQRKGLELLLRVLGKLPWACWNVVAFFLFLLLFRILRYRRKVVFDNLTKSFPHKSTGEIQRIEIAFYRHLCDLMIETLRSFGFTKKEVEKAVVIRENQYAKSIKEDELNTIFVFGHYHNWEFAGQSCGLFFTEKYKQNVVGFFKTIRNKTVEELMNHNRTRFGGQIFSDRQPRAVIKILQEKNKTLLGMVADQTPPGKEQMYLLNFLGRPTPFFTGPGWIAAAAGLAVYYGRVNKIARHQYEIIPELLYKPNPDHSRQDVIRIVTEAYAAKLEAQILEHPEFWLWSHRRWKYAPGELSQQTH